MFASKTGAYLNKTPFLTHKHQTKLEKLLGRNTLAYLGPFISCGENEVL